MNHSCDGHYHQLLELLGRQEGVVDQLLVTAQRQQDALLANDLAAIQAAVDIVNDLARELATLENDRLGVQQLLEQQLDLPKDITLQALLLLAETDHLKTGLKEISRRLRPKMLTLQELNNANNTLLNNAIGLNNYLLKLLLPQQTYSGTGSLTGPAGGNVLVNKTI